MYVAFAIAGLLVGVLVVGWGNYTIPGAVGGAVIGIVFARLNKLEKRVHDLESSRQKGRPKAAVKWAKPEQIVAAESVGAEAETESPWFEAGEEQREAPAPFQIDESKLSQMTDGSHAQPGAAPGPSVLQTVLRKLANWFSTGNVPVKVGVVISFIGVAFLLKYAIDRELVVISLQLRLWLVAVAGLAMVLTGWRLRVRRRVYALSLQGGGVGILFLTVFAALQIWQLLPETLSFMILVALTICTGALAVMQNARSLAVLAVIGGFLAPILTSTEPGNHVILFSYYLVLNAAILGIAWFRAWRELNLVGWAFTFLVGAAWGLEFYKPELLGSTMPFLILHFLFYQAIAILFALRQPPRRIGFVDGALVFGTPIIAFAMQAVIVEGLENALAYSAITATVFYALTAGILWRSKGAPLRLLIESYLALGVVFATIAVPLAFDARWTSAAWAVEGAALVWIGARQNRQLAKFAGTLLVMFSGIAFMENGWQSNVGLPVLNGNVLGGALISISALFASRKLDSSGSTFALAFKLGSLLLFTWGVLWWLGTGFVEISDRVGFDDSAGHHKRLHYFLLYLTSSTGLAIWLANSRLWVKIRRATLFYLPLLTLIALLYTFDYGHFLVSTGWLNWPLVIVVQVFVLKLLDAYGERLAGLWHFISLLVLTGLIAFETSWWTSQIASDDWAMAVAATVPGLMALLVWRFQKSPAWPVPVHREHYIIASIVLVISQVTALVALAISQPGNPAPWIFIPVFNPFDLAMLFAMFTAMMSLRAWREFAGSDDGGPANDLMFVYRPGLAVAIFILTTAALVRGVHHYTGVAWDGDALFESVIVQTALSIYWGLLGFTGMILGARSSKRGTWLAGVGFMGLVVLKLFTIDLGSTGTVERIVSFIGIGVLLLVVGYFAPAPPKAARKSG